MSILYRWLNDDKSIMSFIFHPTSTWDDFYNLLYQAFDEMHTVNHPIDIIVDLSRLTHFQPQMIKELHYLAQLQHINIRDRLIISQNPLFHQIYSAFLHSYPVPSRQLHLCRTMEDAYLFMSVRRILN